MKKMMMSGVSLIALAGILILGYSLLSLPMLPASPPAPKRYQGTLPCADCLGVDTLLYLDTDDTYLLQEIRQLVSGGRETQTEIGLWRQTAGVLTLSSNQGKQRVFTLRGRGLELPAQGESGSLSRQTHGLQPVFPQLPKMVVKMSGWLSHTGKGAVFEECVMGKRFPMYDAPGLLLAYPRELRPEAAVFVKLDGEFRMEALIAEGRIEKSLLLVNGPGCPDCLQRVPRQLATC